MFFCFLFLCQNFFKNLSIFFKNSYKNFSNFSQNAEQEDLLRAPKKPKFIKLTTIDFLLLVIIAFSKIFSLENSYAARQINEVNYFASLRSNETNIRSGPGSNYPVKFTFRLKGLPVLVISEYDNWNEIEDYEGQKGWVSQSLISKKRSLLVQTKKKFISLYSRNDEKSRTIFYLENFVIGEYLGCIEDWCNIKVENKKGWVKRNEVFGSDRENEDEEEESDIKTMS